MSVIAFDSLELGNLAASFDLDVEELASVSACNVAAYNAQYKETAKPSTQDDIGAAARAATLRGANHAAAFGVAQLLRYNCVSNNGVDYLTPSAALAMVEIQSVMISRMRERAMAAGVSL
jgi:hypothetical protein